MKVYYLSFTVGLTKYYYAAPSNNVLSGEWITDINRTLFVKCTKKFEPLIGKIFFNVYELWEDGESKFLYSVRTNGKINHAEI